MKPLRKLPEDWAGLKICLKLTGGLGDVLIAVGAAARFLRRKECQITAAIMPWQAELIQSLVGVDNTCSITGLNTPSIRSQYDVLISFNGVFAGPRQIKDRDYYDLVGKLLGHDLIPGDFEGIIKQIVPKSVAIHTGASNPNRRWARERWYDLSTKLLGWGYTLNWLGTLEEYGRTIPGKSLRLSEVSENLRWQVEVLANTEYFIGNDSGFTHVAGMLNIPGTVLFSATHPKNVISRYPKLKGVHCFDELNMVPTRSLLLDDVPSCLALDALTVPKVVSALGLKSNAHECTISEDWQEAKSMRIQLAIVGIGPLVRRLSDWLVQYYDISVLQNFPSQGTKYDLVLEVRETEVRLQTRKSNVRVKSTHPENVHRAIRELRGEEQSYG